MAQLNRDPAHHIGYCGTTSAEIYDSLQHDFGDVPAATAFAVAERAGERLGLLGFDADLAKGRAELWGPFVAQTEGLETAEQLWRALQQLPQFRAQIREAQLFCNTRNTFCRDFAAECSFVEEGSTQILRARRGAVAASRASLLKSKDAAAFTALHDALFPGTYYNGGEILGKLDEQHQVLSAHDELGLCGYVYAEVAPAFGEGSLEFVGVAPRARGRGVGTRLVREALAWVFSFAAVAEVTLVVSTQQEAALRLYRAAGFELKHEMRSFAKTW